MTRGCKALVWVPYRLAWGVQGAEPLIPPTSDIVFELDLVSVEHEQNQYDMSDIGDSGDRNNNNDNNVFNDDHTLMSGVTGITGPTDEHLFASENFDTHSRGSGQTGNATQVSQGQMSQGQMSNVDNNTINTLGTLGTIESNPTTQQYEMTSMASDNMEDQYNSGQLEPL